MRPCKRAFSNWLLIYAGMVLSTIASHHSSAQVSSQGSIDAPPYQIHYSVFPSTILQPDIASAYGLKRSRYEALLNISITPKGKYGGLPATVEGTVTNLMQQQKTLEFMEIREQQVAYYLAPVRVSGEEIVHFAITVLPHPSPDAAQQPAKEQRKGQTQKQIQEQSQDKTRPPFSIHFTSKLVAQ